MGTFAPCTHPPPPSCMCSAAPQWMSHTREEKITLDSFIFVFPIRLGNLKMNRIRSQLTPPLLASLIQGKEKLRTNNINSFPILYPQHQHKPKGNQGVHCPSSVACHWCSGHSSHSKAPILPPYPQLFCIVSVQFILLTEGKGYVSGLLSRQLRHFDMLAIMWLGNRQGNIGNH